MLQMNSAELFAVVLIGGVLAVPIAGAIIRRMFWANCANVSFLKGTPVEAVLGIIVIALGLLSWLITPILPLLVLAGAAKFLPIEKRARAGLLVIGCISIGLGAALTTGNLPFSPIAALKLQGSSYQGDIFGMLGL